MWETCYFPRGRIFRENNLFPWLLTPLYSLLPSQPGHLGTTAMTEEMMGAFLGWFPWASDRGERRGLLELPKCLMILKKGKLSFASPPHCGLHSPSTHTHTHTHTHTQEKWQGSKCRLWRVLERGAVAGYCFQTCSTIATSPIPHTVLTMWLWQFSQRQVGSMSPPFESGQTRDCPHL